MKTFMRLLRDEEGVTAIEYALIAALIACVIIVSVIFAGEQVNRVFNYIATELAAVPML